MKNTLLGLLLSFSTLAAFGQKGLVEYELRKGGYGSNPGGFVQAFIC